MLYVFLILWIYIHVSRDFWAILFKLNVKGQKSLLRFITGSDRVPAGGVQEMEFKISRVSNPQMYAPTTIIKQL